MAAARCSTAVIIASMRCCMTASRLSSVERDIGRAGGLDVVRRLDRGVGEIVERSALRVVRLDRLLQLVDRQAGDVAAILAAHLRQLVGAGRSVLARGRSQSSQRCSRSLRGHSHPCRRLAAGSRRGRHSRRARTGRRRGRRSRSPRRSRRSRCPTWRNRTGRCRRTARTAGRPNRIRRCGVATSRYRRRVHCAVPRSPRLR